MRERSIDKCKCGSSNIIYITRKARGRKSEAYCENCLPVENSDDKANADVDEAEKSGMIETYL